MTDDIIIALVKDRISQPDCENGFLFDGFPRTIPQADALVDQGIDLDAIVEIAVPFDEIIKRMSGRRVTLAPAEPTTLNIIRPRKRALTMRLASR